jgi:hypothetical protein
VDFLSTEYCNDLCGLEPNPAAPEASSSSAKSLHENIMVIIVAIAAVKNRSNAPSGAPPADDGNLSMVMYDESIYFIKL